MIWSLCRISLNGPCGRRTGTTEWRRRVEEEDSEEDEGGQPADGLTQEDYMELMQQEGMSSSPLDFLAPPQTKTQERGSMMLIPGSKSPLYPQHTHHHTSPVSLSSRRVMVKLALHLCVSCCLSPAL